MSFTTVNYEHCKIKIKLLATVDKLLRMKGCQILTHDLRIGIPRLQSYLYADASIICNGPRFDPADARNGTITNPKVIFEVLSDSSEAYDRGDKFWLYKEMETLQEYILISQRRPHAETFLRQDDGWLVHYFDGLDASLIVRSIPLKVSLRDLYRNVTFPPKSPRAPTDG